MNTITEKQYIKPATGQDADLHELIKARYSPRAFQDKEIPEKEIKLLLEAARWAPSSMNAQPWRFLYAFKGENSYELMTQSLMEGNKPWASNAPILLLSMIKTTMDNGTANHSANHDLGLAIGNLTIQAQELGIGIHQMGGFSKASIIELFKLPADIVPVTISALGYYGYPDQLEEPFRSREKAIRTRKPLEEIAYHGELKF